jgi:hypothetical protein
VEAACHAVDKITISMESTDYKLHAVTGAKMRGRSTLQGGIEKNLQWQRLSLISLGQCQIIYSCHQQFYYEQQLENSQQN